MTLETKSASFPTRLPTFGGLRIPALVIYLVSVKGSWRTFLNMLNVPAEHHLLKFQLSTDVYSRCHWTTHRVLAYRAPIWENFFLGVNKLIKLLTFHQMIVNHRIIFNIDFMYHSQHWEIILIHGISGFVGNKMGATFSLSLKNKCIKLSHMDS